MKSFSKKAVQLQQKKIRTSKIRNKAIRSLKTARKLQMAWGVHSCLGKDAQNTREMVANACTIVKKANLAKVDDSIVITAGFPFGNAGSTNLLRIAKITDDNNLT